MGFAAFERYLAGDDSAPSRAPPIPEWEHPRRRTTTARVSAPSDSRPRLDEHPKLIAAKPNSYRSYLRSSAANAFSILLSAPSSDDPRIRRTEHDRYVSSERYSS
jgi:hypothetical protein